MYALLYMLCVCNSFRGAGMAQWWSESIHRVKSEPESCPSPSQVESRSAVYLFSVRPRGLRPSEWLVVVSASFFQIICTYSMSLQMIRYA